MSKAKKIIVVIHILVLSFLFVVPANAYSIGDITIAIDTTTQTLNSSNKITAITEIANIVSNADNGASIELQFVDTGTTAHLGIAAGVFTITFPEAKFVQGQSYNFSFTMSASQSNNDTLVYIPNQQYYYANILKLASSSLWYEVGDTVPQWSNVLNEISPYAGFDAMEPVLKKESRLFNNSVMSCDITIPSDYVENTFNSSNEIEKSFTNRITICMVMRTNYRGDSVTLKNIKITPLGATKALFADFEHNEQVEEDLSNIQQGIDGILGQPEEEKSEANESADDALSGIVGGIENKGTGFFNALSGLVDALSYDGTEAKWKVPPIKIPAINGLWEEIVLTDNTEIDFSYWVDKLPETLLKLIRALSTVALIIYCFKELYETFSYVFTLKKGE